MSHRPGVCSISIISCLDEGYWKGGMFHFDVAIPEDYNNKVVCIHCV